MQTSTQPGCCQPQSGSNLIRATITPPWAISAPTIHLSRSDWTPAPNSFQSGVGLLSGWVCEAEAVTLEIAGQEYPVPYGLSRADTHGSCGDTANGFGMVFNWNELGDGEYEVMARADGVIFDRATVRVTTLGTAFLRDVAGTCEVPDFPQVGTTVTLSWQQAQQNFVISGVE